MIRATSSITTSPAIKLWLFPWVPLSQMTLILLGYNTVQVRVWWILRYLLMFKTQQWYIKSPLDSTRWHHERHWGNSSQKLVFGTLHLIFNHFLDTKYMARYCSWLLVHSSKKHRQRFISLSPWKKWWLIFWYFLKLCVRNSIVLSVLNNKGGNFPIRRLQGRNKL